MLLDDLSSNDHDLQLHSIAHGVITLEQLSLEYGAERRRLRVVKMRGMKYRGGYHDFTIQTGGLAIYPRLVAAEHHKAFLGELTSTGSSQLDALLGGGIERGTSMLLIGGAGVGKSSIALTYAMAAAARGERVGVFAFDEGLGTVFARAAGLGMPLQVHVDSGQIRVQQIDPAEMSPGEFAYQVRHGVEHDGYRVVIIDSLNGYMNAMSEERFLVLQMHELLSTLNQLGVITILVLAQHGLMGPMQTPLDISYLSDAVLMLRYFEAEGRVRRAISVVKKRSGAHEDAIREFRLTAKGLQVGPPYRVSGHSLRRAELSRRCEPAAPDRKPAGLTKNALSHGKGERILVLAPTGRDGSAACALLEQASCRPCSRLDELQRELESGAGAAVIAEEAFLGADAVPLFSCVSNQPPWSDFPFVILTTRRDDPKVRRYTLGLIDKLRNVTLQERPIQTVTLVSAVQAALRARLRQYEAAKYLLEREQAASRLEELVRERTGQLQVANDHLTAAQESLTMALEAAQMRTWNLDLGGYVVGRSARWDRSLRIGAVLTEWSRNVGDRVLLEDQGTFETAFSQALETEKFHLECRVVRPDNETRWVVAEGRLYRDEHGRPLRLAGTVRDVTERRQVEESLRQTQKLEVIGQLTGGVAHDFNNLLTAVLGNIELAALRTRDQNVLGILKSAGTAAERGAKLTGQLLAFARKQHLAPRVVSLNELVSSMGDLLLQTIGVTIRIETVLEKDLWAVMIDPTQLELVILNLAINSRDAMPHGGRLTVATKNIGVSDRPLAPREYVAISVSDTGSGMTQEVAAKAFEPFFTTKPVGQGTGLGLSQVLGFAQQSGGEVRIDSRVGEGTTITILLPRSRESLPRVVEEAGPVPHDGQAATILVVDDDPAVRELTVSALEEMNYRVLAADNGRVAIEVLRQAGTVDLALIDLVMPVMNGRELATRIRAVEPGRAILFMTGYDDLSGSEDPFAQEMVIKKPFKLVELAAAVERALPGRDGERPGWNVTPIRLPKKS